MHDDGIIRVYVCLCRDAHKHTVKKKTRENERERTSERKKVDKHTNDDDRSDDDDVQFPFYSCC
jgi:hypothetical protein